MTRITHNSVFAAHRLMPDDDFKIDIRHFPFLSLSVRVVYRTLKSRLSNLVKFFRKIMREIIIRSIRAEDVQSFRRLQAAEGYLDLGMFEEAAEELRELDPAWFAFNQTLSLQLRVLAGLSQSE